MAASSSALTGLGQGRTEDQGLQPLEKGGFLDKPNGGTDWASAAFDPGTQTLYVNSSNEAEWAVRILQAGRGQMPPLAGLSEIEKQAVIAFLYSEQAGGYATPSTYEVDGRQYVVIAACGGGKPETPPGDAYYSLHFQEI